jgi:hypothetical protein
MRRWAVVLIVLLLVVGCVQSPSRSGGPQTPAGETATPPPSSAGGIQTSPSILDSVTFAGAPLHLPAGWRAMYYVDVSSFFQLVAFLGPDPLPDPCARTSNSTACSMWPSIRLQPNGILAAVWQHGGPLGVSPDMQSGEAVTVAGRPGRFALVDVDEGCRAMGGDEQLRVIVPEQAILNWQQLDGCLRGPDHSSGEAMFRSLFEGLAPGPTELPMESDPTFANDIGYVVGPGKLRLRTFTLSFPEDWQSLRSPVWTGDRYAVAVLGPGPLTTCGNWTSCGIWPEGVLPTNGLVLSIWSRSREGWTLATAAGTPITIAGQAAKLAVAPADPGCAAIGGGESMTAVVTEAFGSPNFYEIDACLRGPDLATNERVVRQMLASGMPTPIWIP